MTTVAYLNTIQIVQRFTSIVHSDRRHLEFSVPLIFFWSMTGNYWTTETLMWPQAAKDLGSGTRDLVPGSQTPSPPNWLAIGSESQIH